MILCQEGSHPHTEPYEISICLCSHCFRLGNREVNWQARGHMLSGRQQARRPDFSISCWDTFYVVQHSLFRKTLLGCYELSAMEESSVNLSVALHIVSPHG